MKLLFLNMKKLNIILFSILLSISAIAQKESENLKTGNKLYKKEKYTDAEVAYRKGLQKNEKSFEANYNLGNALFKQKKYADALEQYKNSVALQPNSKTKLAAALHNEGNALLSEQKIEESITAYKNALKANPTDNETRYNLAYAQTLLKKQQQQKDQNKKEQNKKEQEQKNKDQQQQQQQPQMSKENAQQILDALMQDEKNTMEKAKKQAAKNKKSAEKDW